MQFWCSANWHVILITQIGAIDHRFFRPAPVNPHGMVFDQVTAREFTRMSVKE